MLAIFLFLIVTWLHVKIKYTEHTAMYNEPELCRFVTIIRCLLT